MLLASPVMMHDVLPDFVHEVDVTLCWCAGCQCNYRYEGIWTRCSTVFVIVHYTFSSHIIRYEGVNVRATTSSKAGKDPQYKFHLHYCTTFVFDQEKIVHDDLVTVLLTKLLDKTSWRRRFIV